MSSKDIAFCLLVSFIIVSTTTANTPGAPCQPNNCDSGTTRLECRGQQCFCPNGNRFDWKTGKCYLLVGWSCSGISQNDWTPNSVCPNNRLQCQRFFTETRFKKCAKMHGDPTCASDAECDEDAFLECPTLTRTCSCKANSVFDPDGNKCVLKAEEICSPDPPKTDEELQKCSKFSTCALDGADTKCKCDQGLKPNGDDLCRATHESPCDSKKPCDEIEHLICNGTAVCGCRHDAIYEKVTVSDCRIQANKQCTKSSDEKCVTYSDCRTDVNGRDYCMCDTGLISNQLGQCVLEYGDQCNNGYPCNKEAHQDCLSNICQCEEPNAIYDKQTKSCYIPAGDTCTRDKTPCLANSECIITTGDQGTCYCMDNAIPKNGICVKPYGRTCDPENSLCDPFTFLGCNASTLLCECAREETFYDGFTCRLKVNAGCVDGPGNQQCVDHANCAAGVCQCSTYPGDTGLIGNQLGQCVRSYDAPCGNGETGDCDQEYGHQVCGRFDRCECQERDNMSYNGTDGRCYVLKDKPCSANGVPCQDGLTCNVTCTCDGNMGLVEDEDGKCVRVLGSKCDNNSPLGRCKEDAYMTCLNNSCQCNEGYVEEGEGLRGKCVGSYNRPCGEDDNCNFNASLVCNRNDKCDCASPTDQEYDIKTSHCWTRLNGVCHIAIESIGEGEVPLLCNQEHLLACKRTGEDNGRNLGTCQCMQGYEVFLGACTRGGSTSIFSGIAISVIVISMLSKFVLL